MLVRQRSSRHTLRPGRVMRCRPVFDASLPRLRSESPRLADQFTNQLSSAPKAAEDLCTPVGCTRAKKKRGGVSRARRARHHASCSRDATSFAMRALECCSSWRCGPAHRGPQQMPAQHTTQRITNGSLTPVASASDRGNRQCKNVRGKECMPETLCSS